jgi:hypothetical protein
VKPADIHRFFEDLGRRIEFPVQIVLTGAAAGILQGMTRATLDIDFEIRLKGAGKPNTEDSWEHLQRAIAATARATGITPQYAEDIDAWSMIALPAKRSRLYRRFGKAEVRILDPALWALGKLTRYLSTDIQDLRTVLKHSQSDPHAAVKVWGTALGISPVSSSQTTFRKQVEAFLDQYARDIWGRAASPDTLKQLFMTSAQKARKRRRMADSGK